MAVTVPTSWLSHRTRTGAVAISQRPRPARGRNARGAALAVVLGFTVALTIQVVTGWVAHTNRVPLSDPQYSNKLALLRAHPGFADGNNGQTTLLFLGSSRTFDAIDAGAIGPALSRDLGTPVEAFNFAHAGAGPVTTAAYLRRLLKTGAKPNAVVIEVHPAFLAAQTSPPPEARWLHPVRLRPDELALVSELGLPLPTPSTHGPRGWVTPWHEYRVQLLDRYAPVFSALQFRLAEHATDPHGFVRTPEVPEAQRARLRELTRKQYSDCWADYRPGGSGMKGLCDALETCRTAGIRAALLITPESTEFRSWFPEPGRSQIVPLVSELASEFRAPFFDAREWLADEFLGDGHHLSGAGADVFTARLGRESLGPWLRASVTGGAP